MGKYKITRILVSLFFILNTVLIGVVFFTPDLAGPGTGFAISYFSMFINPIVVLFYPIIYLAGALGISYEISGNIILPLLSLLSYVFLGIIIDYIYFRIKNKKNQIQGSFYNLGEVKKTTTYTFVLIVIFVILNLVTVFKTVYVWRCENVNEQQYQKDSCYKDYIRRTDDFSLCEYIKDSFDYDISGCREAFLKKVEEEYKIQKELVKENGKNININIKLDATEEEIFDFINELKAMGLQVKYLSREDALIAYKERYKDNADVIKTLEELNRNPMNPMVIITIYDLDKEYEIISWLRTNQRSLVDGLVAND